MSKPLIQTAMYKVSKMKSFLLSAALAIGVSVQLNAVEVTGTKVFEEDFEKGLDNWQILDPKTWKHSEGNGNHTLEITARESEYAPPHRSPLHIALIKNLNLGDFEIRFRVRSTKDTGNHRDCCVFFNYQDNKHFYYVHLGAKPDPHSGQIMIVNDAPRLALTKNEKPTPWDNEWHNVRLVRNSTAGTIAVYFDDNETALMEVNDKTFATGQIGIGSFDDMNEFDDIEVYSFESSER